MGGSSSSDALRVYQQQLSSGAGYNYQPTFSSAEAVRNYRKQFSTGKTSYLNTPQLGFYDINNPNPASGVYNIPATYNSTPPIYGGSSSMINIPQTNLNGTTSYSERYVTAGVPTQSYISQAQPPMTLQFAAPPAPIQMAPPGQNQVITTIITEPKMTVGNVLSKSQIERTMGVKWKQAISQINPQGASPTAYYSQTQIPGQGSMIQSQIVGVNPTTANLIAANPSVIAPPTLGVGNVINPTMSNIGFGGNMPQAFAPQPMMSGLTMAANPVSSQVIAPTQVSTASKINMYGHRMWSDDAAAASVPNSVPITTDVYGNSRRDFVSI